MAEYIDRETLKEWILKQKRLAKGYVVQMLDETPTADVVEVVQCKDCKHFMLYTAEHKETVEGADGDCYLRLMNSECKQFVACKHDDYCSYGERKEQEP